MVEGPGNLDPKRPVTSGLVIDKSTLTHRDNPSDYLRKREDVRRGLDGSQVALPCLAPPAPSFHPTLRPQLTPFVARPPSAVRPPSSPTSLERSLDLLLFSIATSAERIIRAVPELEVPPTRLSSPIDLDQAPFPTCRPARGSRTRARRKSSRPCQATSPRRKKSESHAFLLSTITTLLEKTVCVFK